MLLTLYPLLSKKEKYTLSYDDGFSFENNISFSSISNYALNSSFSFINNSNVQYLNNILIDENLSFSDNISFINTSSISLNDESHTVTDFNAYVYVAKTILDTFTFSNIIVLNPLISKAIDDSFSFDIYSNIQLSSGIGINDIITMTCKIKMLKDVIKVKSSSFKIESRKIIFDFSNNISIVGYSINADNLKKTIGA